MNKAKFLKESYELATKQPFGHFPIDLDTKASDSLRYCSNIVQPSPTVFYLPSSKAALTTLTDERERVMYAKGNARAAREQFQKVPQTGTKKLYNLSLRVFAQCDQWRRSSEQAVT